MLFADIDNDGDPDLFVTTVRHGNRLFENLATGSFATSPRSRGGIRRPLSGAVFFDYDGDGLLDLFVTNVGVYTSNVQGPGGYYVGLSDAFMGHLPPRTCRSEHSLPQPGRQQVQGCYPRGRARGSELERRRYGV